MIEQTTEQVLHYDYFYPNPTPLGIIIFTFLYQHLYQYESRTLNHYMTHSTVY